MFERQSLPRNFYASVLSILGALALIMLVLTVRLALQVSSVGSNAGRNNSDIAIAPYDQERVNASYSARLKGLAGQSVNLYGSTNWVRAQNQILNRAQTAEAARLTGMAIANGQRPEQISPRLAQVLEY